MFQYFSLVKRPDVVICVLCLVLVERTRTARVVVSFKAEALLHTRVCSYHYGVMEAEDGLCVL
jgi:hypothetical protein